MLKQSRNAMGNLINRYRAVLRACRLCNIFGSLALAAAVLLTASPAAANSGGADSGNDYIGTSPPAVVIIDSTVAGSVYGEKETMDDAAENSVTLKDGADVKFNVYGGYTGQGDAEGNTVTMTGGTVGSGGDSGNVYGGYVMLSSGKNPDINNAAKNNVTLMGGSVQGSVYGGCISSPEIASGSSTQVGRAYDNSVMLTGDVEVEGSVYGGYFSGFPATNSSSTIENTGSAEDNSVKLYGGTVTGNVYGGYFTGGSATISSVTDSSAVVENTGSAEGNSVELYGGTVTGNVYGGYFTGGSATISSVTDSSAVVENTGSAKGNSSAVVENTGSAKGNSVELYGGTVTGNVYGGYFTGGSATISSVTDSSAVVVNTGSAEDNSVKLYGGTVTGNVYGGYTRIGDAAHNSVMITGGTVGSGGNNGYVYGGYTAQGDAEGNRVTITGGTVGKSVYGGYVFSSGNATGNVVELYGGTVTGNVYGGYVTGGDTKSTVSGGTITVENTGNATGNTVRLAGSPKLSSAVLYGGYISNGSSNVTVENTGDAVSGNMLEVTGFHTVQDVKNFSTYNLTTTSLSPNGTPMLTLLNTGGSDISGSTVAVTIPDLSGSAPALAEGDRIPLIFNKNGLTAERLSSDISSVKQGVSLLYDFSLDISSEDVALQVASARANPQAKSLAEGHLAGTVLALQGADLVAGQGMRNALRAVEEAGSHHFAGFGAISGSSLSYDTGSSIDMKSLSLLIGLAWSAPLTPGTFTAGAFFEYGNGSYDTWNSFINASSVHGDGHAWYMGGGLLARMDFRNTGPGHFYLEASGRAGGLHNDYGNDDLRDAAGRSAEYESCSAYYGLHTGAGYVWNITDEATLDL